MLISFAVPLKQSVPQAQRWEISRPKALWKFSRFTLHCPSGGQSTCSSKISYQLSHSVPCNVFCCNMFECFFNISFNFSNLGEVSARFQSPLTSSLRNQHPVHLLFFSIIFLTLDHDRESTIFWQMILETFIANSTPHFIPSSVFLHEHR